jgi:hypothetical protein
MPNITYGLTMATADHNSGDNDMGVFRRTKDPKPITNATSELMRDTIDSSVNAQASQEVTAVQAADVLGVNTSLPQIGDLAPIAGVDIAAYGWVAKRIAAYNYDRNLLEGFAATRGITAEAWQEASAGWAVRMTNPIVASEFRRHYDAS